jgi:hypothetical protein
LIFDGSTAADIVYHVNDRVGVGSVTGTITTDGTTGTLFTFDIVAFNLTLNDVTGTAILTSGVNGGTVFVSGGSLKQLQPT